MASDNPQEHTGPAHAEQQAAQHSEEPVDTAVTESPNPDQDRGQPKRKWIQKINNWIRLLTLLFVGVYTVITFGIFYSGYRPFIYFNRAVVRIVDEPVPPESKGGITGFNPPSVTHKVVSINFLLTNAGNTPTRNMRVILDCRPVSFIDLQKVDPFTKFKWDDNIARPEVVGPKQTIEVGPCKTEANSEAILNARMGTVPIILMGEIRYEHSIGWGIWSKHVTQFSQRLVISSLDASAGKINATTHSVGRHNCSDDCPNEQN